MNERVAIQLDTLTRLADGFRESRGITNQLTTEQMIAFAKEPVGGGDNKLSQVIDKTVTEITAADLEGATKIGTNAFHSCSELINVTIPDSVTTIDNNAFYACSSLASFTFPSSVTKINDYIFYSCAKLASVTIPDNVYHIGNSAFNGCSILNNVTLPDRVNYIGSNAFGFCKGLTSIVIPDRVTSLNSSTFAYCEELTSVTIGTGVTSISGTVFRDCYKLTSLTIPSNVTNIGVSALSIGRSNNKATITFLGTTPPTITTSTFNANTLNKIIVPAGSGEAYRTATNWANFADYIEEAAA